MLGPPGADERDVAAAGHGTAACQGLDPDLVTRVEPGQRHVEQDPASDQRGHPVDAVAAVAAAVECVGDGGAAVQPAVDRDVAQGKAPEHAAVISQVLAIPPRRRERAIVSYLTAEEIDALVAAPGRETWHGRRDHALLLLDIQTGMRVSELTGLKRQDIHHGRGCSSQA